MVQIDDERYKELLRQEKVLDALYACGVDNWEWYDDAMDAVEDDD